MARTAEVKRDARIGEADARADSQIKEAIAEEERLAARLANDIEIAKAQRDFELKKAAYDAEVQTKVRSIGWGLGGAVDPSRGGLENLVFNVFCYRIFVVFFMFWGVVDP